MSLLSALWAPPSRNPHATLLGESRKSRRKNAAGWTGGLLFPFLLILRGPVFASISLDTLQQLTRPAFDRRASRGRKEQREACERHERGTSEEIVCS